MLRQPWVGHKKGREITFLQSGKRAEVNRSPCFLHGGTGHPTCQRTKRKEAGVVGEGTPGEEVPS